MIFSSLGADVAIWLALALMLDAWLGEPEWLWSKRRHPAALMGGAVGWLERRLNWGEARRTKGVVALALLLTPLALLASLAQWPMVIGPALAMLGAAALLAHNSLMTHVEAVADGLDRNLEDGRRAVAQIVGRDPETLDEAGVSRAAIESCAENFSDGVVAPAFWFLIAGLPGVVLYKAINTADSMIGHRSERYREFGWAAARLDDLVNWVPARLSGWLIALASGHPRRAIEAMRRDAGLHASPNAGWPEAATAGALELALAGPRLYDGAPTSDPYLNPEGRHDASAADIRRAAALARRAWAALLFAVLSVGAVLASVG